MKKKIIGMVLAMMTMVMSVLPVSAATVENGITFYTDAELAEILFPIAVICMDDAGNVCTRAGVVPLTSYDTTNTTEYSSYETVLLNYVMPKTASREGYQAIDISVWYYTDSFLNVNWNITSNIGHFGWSYNILDPIDMTDGSYLNWELDQELVSTYVQNNVPVNVYTALTRKTLYGEYREYEVNEANNTEIVDYHSVVEYNYIVEYPVGYDLSNLALCICKSGVTSYDTSTEDEAENPTAEVTKFGADGENVADYAFIKISDYLK